MQPFRSSLEVAEIEIKLALIDASCQKALAGQSLSVPSLPARDLEVCAVHALPNKPGLSSSQGQARLLHDLASIELQAMELGLRTLIEFPNAPEAFRRELAAITCEEGEHLKFCLSAIRELGFSWGDWPAHVGLWQSVRPADSLLDRILIVHRYLEGSGLDAGETIQRRLSGVKASLALEVSQRIARDEIQHVLFGSDWFRRICKDLGLDASSEFSMRLKELFPQLPRRLEPLARSVRLAAGFTEDELSVLTNLKQMWQNPRTE